MGAGDIGADEVALHHIVRFELAGHRYPVLRISRNDIARARGRAADKIVTDGSWIIAASNVHSVVAITQRLGAGDVSADEISLYRVVERAKGDLDSDVVVARDNIARAGGRATDEIARPVKVNPHSD